jgi:uncharacterized radical SAM protein YgiQ
LFLPITQKEVKARGWETLDVILISGDAYVDHPSFGSAVIARFIESLGYKVAVIPQPNWQDDLRDFKKLGKPNLFFAVTSGCMDSMVNHYTADKRKRSDDAYTAGGKAGFRPDNATTVYSKILKTLYPETPVVIGGIEASLRRVTHYDYWSNSLKPSILIDSQADLLLYGMAENPLRELLRLLEKNIPFSSLTTIPQTALLISDEKTLPKNKLWEDYQLNSHQKCLKDKKAFAKNFKYIEQESNKIEARRLLQNVMDGTLVINPPYPPMTEKEIDRSFSFPYTRMPHPKYKKRGAIPAYEMIKHSVTLHRGCFGGCSFCTISAHQGKFIASRSEKSILKEIDAITQMENFKGYISDMGGPSANMYKMQGIDLELCKKCRRPSCIHPKICFNLNTNHSDLTNIYQKVSANPKIKKAFVGSGVRYDLLVDDNGKHSKSNFNYIKQLVRYHVSGRLKIAPEHTSQTTLKIMRKPSFTLFYKFKKLFDQIDKKYNLNQQLIPYFISSHPGSGQEDMAELAAETKTLGFRLEQVQNFTPTPMTVAAVIYYSGYHPYTLEKVYSAKSPRERKEQNRFFFWYKKENRGWLSAALKKMGREDLLKKLLKR